MRGGLIVCVQRVLWKVYISIYNGKNTRLKIKSSIILFHSKQKGPSKSLFCMILHGLRMAVKPEMGWYGCKHLSTTIRKCWLHSEITWFISKNVKMCMHFVLDIIAYILSYIMIHNLAKLLHIYILCIISFLVLWFQYLGLYDIQFPILILVVSSFKTNKHFIYAFGWTEA